MPLYTPIQKWKRSVPFRDGAFFYAQRPFKRRVCRRKGNGTMKVPQGEKGENVKRIVLSIQNQLLSEALSRALSGTGNFRPVQVPTDRLQDTAYLCQAMQAQILLMDVANSPAAAMARRLEVGQKVRGEVPSCRLVLLCDENADPLIAQQVKEAKQVGRIDAFFYASVTTAYLTAALDAL